MNEEAEDQALRRLEALAKLMDTAFVVPGTNVRFGLGSALLARRRHVTIFPFRSVLVFHRARAWSTALAALLLRATNERLNSCLRRRPALDEKQKRRHRRRG